MCPHPPVTDATKLPLCAWTLYVWAAGCLCAWSCSAGSAHRWGLRLWAAAGGVPACRCPAAVSPAAGSLCLCRACCLWVMVVAMEFTAVPASAAVLPCHTSPGGDPALDCRTWCCTCCSGLCVCVPRLRVTVGAEEVGRRWWTLPLWVGYAAHLLTRCGDDGRDLWAAFKNLVRSHLHCRYGQVDRLLYVYRRVCDGLCVCWTG